MDGISISTERIATAGADVSDVAGLLMREIGTMGDLLAQISGGWQSDSAAPRFAAVMNGYLEQATQLTKALISHGSTLVAAGHRFAEAESSLAQGMQGGI
jgi:WXG100 family type VII secretion target